MSKIQEEYRSAFDKVLQDVKDGMDIKPSAAPIDTKPSEFKKNDEGKLEWSLLPFEQLEDVVRVLMNGAEKYSRDNWKKCDDVNRYKDALMRHVVSYIEGEKFDKGKDGDNLHHLAHAICNCLFLLWFDKKETDEWKKFLEINQKK